MPGADEILERTLFIGVYPGLTTSMLNYVVESIHEFAARR
jgi:CDP-6-deoxy-D-xylo-4-hexulose-3-dehydrase